MAWYLSALSHYLNQCWPSGTPRNMHTIRVSLEFCCSLLPSTRLPRTLRVVSLALGNHATVPMPAELPQRIWVNKSGESTKQIIKPQQTKHNKIVCILHGIYSISRNRKPELTHKQLETHRCVPCTVAIDIVVLKHQAISTHSAD